MKILVALDNEFVKNTLIEKYGDKVYSQDIIYMEGVIEFLSKTNEEYIVITKDNLNGNLNKMTYAKQLKLANDKAKIIYIVESLKSEYKEFLFANEIFNIIESNNLNIGEIQESIENYKSVIYKYIDSKNNIELIKDNIDNGVKKEVITKQVIAIYGTSGSGKSFVSSIIAKNLANKLNLSVALLDMDIQNPSIDIINNIDCNTNSLSKIVEDVDKKVDIKSNIQKYMLKDENSNISYMTNNVSIFECQNKLSNKYYKKIYDSINLNYDYSIIDLPSSPFLDVVQYALTNVSKIFFVVNPNYVSIRQAIKYLDLLTKLWDISNAKIDILVNKCQKNSLDNIQIESILRGYKIVGNILYNREMDSYINGAKNSIDFDINCNPIYESLGINIKDIRNSKLNVIKSFIFNSRELISNHDNKSI